jgi:hypothetical protein
VNDKVRKGHRVHEVQAQIPLRERDSSSVHQRLQYEVGPQTCGKPVVLKIPVKKKIHVKENNNEKMGTGLLYVVQGPSPFLPN